MSNRRDRRAAHKAKPGWKKASKEERIRSLLRNGITPKDLEEEYNRGYFAGVNDTSTTAMKYVFASVCIALKELHGFGSMRLGRVLDRAYAISTNALTAEDCVRMCNEQTGVLVDVMDKIPELEALPEEME